jgi:hypothetical protein
MGMQATMSGLGTGYSSFSAGFIGTETAKMAIASSFTSSFASGAAIGAVSGSASGGLLGAGNEWVSGGSFKEGIVAGGKGALLGGISGAAIGGVAGGIDAARDGRDFWSGGGEAMQYPGSHSRVSYEELLSLNQDGGRAMITVQNYNNSGSGHAMAVKKILYVRGQRFDAVVFDPYNGSRHIIRNFTQGTSLGESCKQ